MRCALCRGLVLGALLASVARADFPITLEVNAPDPMAPVPQSATHSDGLDSEVARIVLGSRISNDPRDHERGISLGSGPRPAGGWLATSGLARTVEMPEDLTEPVSPLAAPSPDFDF